MADHSFDRARLATDEALVVRTMIERARRSVFVTAGFTVHLA